MKYKTLHIVALLCTILPITICASAPALKLAPKDIQEKRAFDSGTYFKEKITKDCLTVTNFPLVVIELMHEYYAAHGNLIPVLYKSSTGIPTITEVIVPEACWSTTPLGNELSATWPSVLMALQRYNIELPQYHLWDFAPGHYKERESDGDITSSTPLEKMYCPLVLKEDPMSLRYFAWHRPSTITGCPSYLLRSLIISCKKDVTRRSFNPILQQYKPTLDEGTVRALVVSKLVNK